MVYHSENSFNHRLTKLKSLFSWTGTDAQIPYFFISDEGFALSTHIMRPYSQISVNRSNTELKNLFNERLSFARRIVEMTFGILCQRFRIFFTPINILPETVDKIIIAACILHNLMAVDNDHEDITVRGDETNEVFENIGSIRPGRTPCNAADIRDVLASYFANHSQ